MKIGICGAQSVGKTTLINALRSESSLKDFTICKEVTRKVKKLGLEINENGSDITQSIIMKEHIYNLFMYDNLISDRTTLDGIVYTAYLKQTGKVSEACFKDCLQIFQKSLTKYDYQFYIQPEFEIEDDGVRSVDKAFRDDIVKLFDNYIKTYNVNVITLSGSVRERVETILLTIGKLKLEFL